MSLLERIARAVLDSNRIVRAFSAASRQRRHEALAILDKLGRHMSQDYSVHLLRGAIYSNLKMHDAAMSHLEAGARAVREEGPRFSRAELDYMIAYAVQYWQYSAAETGMRYVPQEVVDLLRIERPLQVDLVAKRLRRNFPLNVPLPDLEVQPWLKTGTPQRPDKGKCMWEKEPDLVELRRLHGLLGTDPVRALAQLKQLADRGSLMSMIYLGDSYRNGVGTSVDLLQAEEWYRRAADAGSEEASYELGRTYLTQKDYEKARQAFEASAEHDYAPALNMLGVIHMRGRGVPVDLNKGREFLERATERGHIHAKYNLGYLLMREKFSFRQALRGLRLVLEARKDIWLTHTREPHSVRLR